MSNMARIIDEGTVWRLDLYPEAVIQYDSFGNVDPDTVYNPPTKRYHGILGINPATDQYVIKSVWYDKESFPIGEVLKMIDGMKVCSKCDTLDKERLKDLTIESAGQPEPQYNPVQTPVPQSTLMDRYQKAYIDASLVQPDRAVKYAPNPPTYAPNPSTPAPGTRTDVKTMFADAMFDAYLTPAGKLMWGNVFGDADLVESAYPKNVNEMSKLVEQTTAGEFLRNPDEAKEFFAAIHSGDTDDGGKPVTQSKVRKTKGIVIY